MGFFLYLSAGQPWAVDWQAKTLEETVNLGIGYLVLARTKKKQTNHGHAETGGYVLPKYFKHKYERRGITLYIIYSNKSKIFNIY